MGRNCQPLYAQSAENSAAPKPARPPWLHLGRGEQRLHPPAEHDTGAVDAGKYRNHPDGEQLPRAESETVLAAEQMHAARDPLRGERVDVGHEDGDGRTVGRHGRAPQHERVAGEQEPGDLAVGAAQVDVFSTGVRQQRTEFGKTQRAEHGHEARGGPGPQHQRRRADRLGNGGALEEDAGADDDPDHERDGVGERQVAARLQLIGGHGRYRTIARSRARRYSS